MLANPRCENREVTRAMNLVRAREVEVKLVDRCGLHERRVVEQDLAYLAVLARARTARHTHEDRARTQPQRLRGWHSGTDTKCTAGIRRGRHDTAVICRPAYEEQLFVARALRVFELRDLHEVGVAVCQQNFADHTCARITRFHAETRRSRGAEDLSSIAKFQFTPHTHCNFVKKSFSCVSEGAPRIPQRLRSSASLRENK